MIAGLETMSWRGKYIGWYRIAQESLVEMVPELTDKEIMENVTPNDQLNVPTRSQHLQRNKAKPLPNLSIRLYDTNIEVGILYRDQKELELLKHNNAIILNLGNRRLRSETAAISALASINQLFN